MVQINPRNNMLNIIDHEDVSLREDKLASLLKLMERDTGLKLKEIMEKELITRKRYFDTKIRDIERYKKFGKLLDVGCAQGAFLSACSVFDFELYGIEPSKNTYLQALKIAPDSTIYNCTLLETQFPDDDFDVVTIFSTIEHLLKPKETMTEVYRILKPSGLVVIETPNMDSCVSYFLGKRWIPLSVPDHVTFFSKDILAEMLKDVGFEVQEIKFSYRIISIRLFLFHLSNYFMLLSKVLRKICERIGIADKAVYIPRYDEMVLFATKPK